MFTPLPPFRPVALVAMVCAVFAALSLQPATSLAMPAVDWVSGSSQAVDLRTDAAQAAATDPSGGIPRAFDVRTDAAQRSATEAPSAPQAEYYASYDDPKSVPGIASSGSADDTPWLVIGLGSGAALLLAALGAARLGRRRPAHRHAHVPA